MTDARPPKRANLRDVARAADVSVATVSRVLNTPAKVRAPTRERVERAIANLGFHPSPAARAINSGRTRIVGALIPTLTNDIFAKTIEAIEKRLGDFGYSLVVTTTDDDPAKELRRAKELLNLGVEGLYLSGITHSADLHALIAARRIPAVALSYYDPTFTYPTIGYDNAQAARLARDHLLDLGHKNIAVIHGPLQSNDRTRARVAAIKDGNPPASFTFHETEMSATGGAKIAAQLSDANTAIDALLCVSDVTAFGAVFELNRRNIKIPEDIAVVGIHDLPIANITAPRLSSVRLPAQEMGTAAAEALATWLDADVRPEPTCFDVTLIRRETT